MHFLATKRAYVNNYFCEIGTSAPTLNNFQKIHQNKISHSLREILKITYHSHLRKLEEAFIGQYNSKRNFRLSYRTLICMSWREEAEVPMVCITSQNTFKQAAVQRFRCSRYVQPVSDDVTGLLVPALLKICFKSCHVKRNCHKQNVSWKYRR